MPGLSQPEPRAQGSRRLLDAGKSAGGGYCSGCERSGWGGLGGGVGEGDEDGGVGSKDRGTPTSLE